MTSALVSDLIAARAQPLIDGQVYRWRWADPDRDADCGPYRSYHCKSTIGVVKNGLLIDTFWFDMSPDNAVRLEDVEITYLCDTSWPTISPGSIPYYAAEKSWMRCTCDRA